MKLRQKIAVGLCAFYLLSVIAIALNLHFCSPKLSSVNFTERASCKVCKSADRSKIAKNDSCANDSKDADPPKSYGVAVLFAPVIAEFLGDLMPGVFPKKDNKAEGLL